MTEADYRSYSKAFFANSSGALQDTLARHVSVDFGIIKAVPARGVVDVLTSAARAPRGVRMVRCVLVSPASELCSVYIEPKEGDKAVVLVPHYFNPDMFSADSDEPIIDEGTPCNSPSTGLALLLNQVQPSHRNTVSVTSDGGITVKMLRDPDTGDYGLRMSVTSDGEIEIEGSPSKDMKVTAAGCSLELTSDGTKINGRLLVRKEGS